MQEERLTENGIDKLMGNIPGVIVQVLGVQQKEKNNTRFFGCELSDGYCKLRGCLIVDEQAFNSDKAMKEFLVIKIMSSSLQYNKQKQPILIVQFYKPVVENISQVVGKPLYYEDFMKKGKNNPEGNNLIVKDAVKGQGAQKTNKTVKRQQVFEESKTNDENGKVKNMLKTNKQKDSNSRPYSKDSSNSNNVYQSKLNIGPKVDQKGNNNRPQSKEINRNDPRVKTGPIERLEKKQQRKSSPMPKGQQRKPKSQYTEIKSLYTGMQNWMVLARVLFVNPVRQIMTKKGTESSILNLQIGDKSGTMECTIFGETAQRFEGTLKQDQVYQISCAMIQQSSYMGKHELKMTINDQTKVSLKQDDSDIPFSQDFCISVKKLTEIPIGQTARVICLIKDQNQPINFTSKAGKQLRKKLIYLCDPEEKIQVELILWNDKSQLRFEKFPYMIKGVTVGQFRESRQYSVKPNFQYRILKQHNLRKYIKDMESIAFYNPDSNHKPRQSNINNFNELKNSTDEVGASVWSQVVCYLRNIRLASKNFYISCPSCKKKVQHEQDSECQHCRKPYQLAKYRYILNVNLCDNHDSIWATAYDEVGEQLLSTNGQILTAKQFSQLQDDDLVELVKILKYKHLKLKMVTKNEEYNNEVRKKTSIIKILDLNYAEETKCVLAKLQSLLHD